MQVVQDEFGDPAEVLRVITGRGAWRARAAAAGGGTVVSDGPTSGAPCAVEARAGKVLLAAA